MLEKEITFDRFIRWAMIALLIIGIYLLVNRLSTVLLPFFVAWLFAYLLYPIVKFVQYKLHVPTRVLSIIVTLIFVIAIVGGVIWLIIPPMIEQFSKLGNLMTAYIHKTIEAGTGYPRNAGFCRKGEHHEGQHNHRGW